MTTPAPTTAEPPTCAVCKKEVLVSVEAHVVQPACGHYLHHVCSRRMDTLQVSKCAACPPLALTHGAAVARGGYSSDPGHDRDTRTSIMYALECADFEAGGLRGVCVCVCV